MVQEGEIRSGENQGSRNCSSNVAPSERLPAVVRLFNVQERP